MKCGKCEFTGTPNLEEVGPHTKATCPECGAYIKMVGGKELDKIVTATIDGTPSEETTLVIHTTAPRSYMTIILSRVKISLNSGYICGEGSVFKPFDKAPYKYEFYYKK